MTKKTLFIVDAYNLIYRMFYAIPEMHTRTGNPVNAIFGVAKFLKGLAEENPDASLVVATDVGRSFREDIFPDYKGQRDRMPDNLRSQIDGVFELFRASQIDILAYEGYEADDIIGSIAHQHENNSYQVVIISSDKDLCQFVKDGYVHIYDAMKRKFMKRSDVIEKFGVPPEQVRDYLAIVGDSSDNIPGISGFGPKKATDLLSKYGTLDTIYEKLDELTTKMKEILIAEKENAFLSQTLATIKTDLPIIPLPEHPFARGIIHSDYISLLRKYEFRSLISGDSPLNEEKTETKVAPIEVIGVSILLDIQKEIELGKINRIVLSTDNSGKVVLGISEKIYVIDAQKIDLREFFDVLLVSDVEIVGYNLKEDLKRIHAIQKPLELGVSEDQGRLF